MLLFNQALRPTENSAMAHCWVMACRLQTSDLCFAPPIFVFDTVFVDVLYSIKQCSRIFIFNHKTTPSSTQKTAWLKIRKQRQNVIR